MTNYATEEYLITHIALGFRNEPLTGDDLADVKVTIYSAGEKLVDFTDQAMEWNPDPVWSIRVGSETITGQGWWEYLWNTVGMASGSYKAKVVLTGTTGGINFEILRIRLVKDPLAAT